MMKSDTPPLPLGPFSRMEPQTYNRRERRIRAAQARKLKRRRRAARERSLLAWAAVKYFFDFGDFPKRPPASPSLAEVEAQRS